MPWGAHRRSRLSDGNGASGLQHQAARTWLLIPANRCQSACEYSMPWKTTDVPGSAFCHTRCAYFAAGWRAAIYPAKERPGGRPKNGRDKERARPDIDGGSRRSYDGPQIQGSTCCKDATLATCAIVVVAVVLLVPGMQV
ncbi:hypothetical protein F5144DRAFT_285609 [Chaetomium tenue]|uniref:Uncharacterized protein n=1 Tax=Chaetomium tenue TaxID=1854479 RepID=A0ACB7P3U2_9PEZI|nr:hypothetical protein F5144DRAFT_285609 [Chaetomium globosum]